MKILSLGEKIKSKRKELNMTLKDLAKDRITPGQISLVESGRSNPSMDLLEYIAQNLNTTVEYLMESEESQAEKIVSYYQNLIKNSIYNNDIDQAQFCINKSQEYCNKYDIEYRRAKNLFFSGEILEMQGKLEDAEQDYLSANIVFSKYNKCEDIIATLLKLAKITIKTKSFYSSNSYLKQAEMAYLENNIFDDNILGEIYFYMSRVYYLLENFEQSLKYAKLSEEKFESVYDKEKYVTNLLEISKKYSENGDIDNAVMYSNRAIKVQNESKNSLAISNVENSLGELFYDLNKIDNSVVHFDRAKKIKMIYKSSNLNKTLINICKSYIKKKEIDKCEKLLSTIYQSLDNSNIKERLECDFIKYRILCIKERTIEAESLLIDIYNYAKKAEVYDTVSELCIMISKFYLDNRKEDLAKKYLDEAVSIYTSNGTIDE